MKMFKKLTGVVLAAAAAVSLSACTGAAPGNVGDVELKNGDLIAEVTFEDYGVIRFKLFPDVAPNAVENFQKLAEKGYYDGLKIHRVVPDTCIQGGSLNGDGTGGSAEIGDGTFATEISQDARNFYGAVGYAHNGDGQNATQFYIVTNKKIQDLSQYDPSKMREKANSYTELAAAITEEVSAIKDQYMIQAEYYNNLADMFEKASDEVLEKYQTTGGYPFWDGGYTVFGQVFEGFDVLDKIASVELTMNNSGQLTRPKSDIIIASVKVYEYVEVVPEEENPENKK